MSEFDFDLFVIGAGSGGVRAARMAAAMGVRVAIAEEKHLGGTCVNVGCVPKKLFVYASQFAEEFSQAAGFGWQVDVSQFDWPTLRDNKTREIERLNGVYQNLLVNSGCELIHGRAILTGPNEVEVEGRRYTAERILIAVGGWPHIPNFPGREHVISSNEAFYLEQFPRRVLVVGSGYIGVEFAGIFNGLGADTTLVYRGEQILKGFDEEVRTFAADEIAKKGVDLKANTQIASVEKNHDGSLTVSFENGSCLETDLVMYATGRKPNVTGLGLEALGIQLSAGGAIKVNEQFQTAVPSVYAIGDVIDRVQLTPVALAEGMALVKNLYGQQSVKVDYALIPTAVFCQPPIGTVGLTEAQAREQYGQIEVYRSNFRAMKHTLSGSEERTLMKLLVDKTSRKVLGVHMVGADAGEIIQGIAIALKAGATKEVFDATIGIHPTAAEEFVTMREPVSD
ncbi:glutathione-disulfide reductase [Neptuniibacter sp. CAU 1671]|uniref:glutathione-disulfide reductase n=1 Tax=Neptuniibacter sp. CAU 1671 TaxID=3032593 RepID=UPI0023DBC856|nr:glutathione-disulfide reductase [Neptuniibacter sp. CAU 1671]MDF2182874.1 glutathione-disulfide reductase [Neptuniibacter sp. CAU 1671]